jgi:hypothetical protein
MGFAGDLGAEFTSYLLNFLMQFASSVTSAFLRLFGRKPKDPLPPAENVTAMARNPPVNRLLASSKPRGVFFGGWHNQYVVKPEDVDGHVLVIGGTGSGKSSCVAIPTLRNWKGAVFAVDIKGELHENTRQYRENIKLFDPQNKNNAYSMTLLCFSTKVPTPRRKPAP